MGNFASDAPSSRPVRWAVWRIDDNGNTFVVAISWTGPKPSGWPSRSRPAATSRRTGLLWENKFPVPRRTGNRHKPLILIEKNDVSGRFARQDEGNKKIRSQRREQPLGGKAGNASCENGDVLIALPALRRCGPQPPPLSTPQRLRG